MDLIGIAKKRHSFLENNLTVHSAPQGAKTSVLSSNREGCIVKLLETYTSKNTFCI